ncbi:Uma2 family endonuclease [Argonema antarcticum]|uniref:Uma2 family endonuclease n=1 Tax=Argonema antarcticum TaxID=2942763 RepID=UPI0020139C6B|nr:Uma2 family endonuclease [Argonema antarcticum]MCL1475734.1 Uma2 family endonuclease [Argonema antarcticum A004/B2]
MVVAVQFQTYTVEEFLNLDLPEGQEYELIDGRISPMAEPSGEHENLRSELMVELRMESRRRQLGLLVHPKPVLQLGLKDTRKPDLIAINRDAWNRQTQSEAVLKEAPSIVIEIVSKNWEEDYRHKPLWYAAFGVSELWIVDPLFTVERYPNRKNPKIEEPTISIGQLVNSRSILVEREYEFQSFIGKQRIESRFFADLEITVEEIIRYGKGI